MGVVSNFTVLRLLSGSIFSSMGGILLRAYTIKKPQVQKCLRQSHKIDFFFLMRCVYVTRDTWRWEGKVRVTWNVALWAGSSQQGNALRASTGSNWVTAMYLDDSKQSTHESWVIHINRNEKDLFCCFEPFFVVPLIFRTIESVKFVTQLTLKLNE